MQHRDQEAGSKSGSRYLAKSCEKVVSDSSRAEHIQKLMSSVLRSDLGLKAYQLSTSHFLTPASEGADGDKIKMPS